jgi:hypothetical protein
LVFTCRDWKPNICQIHLNTTNFTLWFKRRLMLKQQKDHQVVPMVFFGWPGRYYIMFATQLLSPFFSCILFCHWHAYCHNGLFCKRVKEILEHVDHHRVWCKKVIVGKITVNLYTSDFLKIISYMKILNFECLIELPQCIVFKWWKCVRSNAGQEIGLKSK